MSDDLLLGIAIGWVLSPVLNVIEGALAEWLGKVIRHVVKRKK